MTDDPTKRAERATQYLIDSAPSIAKARGDLVREENMLRATKALAMKHSGESAVSAQEREAYASQQYQDAVNELANAAGKYEELRALREGAKFQIEYWRSLNANQRDAERGYRSAG